ncbi:hypothetical protein [Ideonella margarita]|uniref:Uncharacterized protein n=1 Tax=Ideonella margarita TaxID=2984191 RepID=A0ABU9C4X3_9BURK
MQKSSLANQPSTRQERFRSEPFSDKGQKFEPFWSAMVGCDRRTLARLMKADQKR